MQSESRAPIARSPFWQYRELLEAAGVRCERRAATIDGASIAGARPRSLLSVVTTAYNSAATIERTIHSVLSQSHRDLEYLIVDGGSTDGTTGIVERYASRLSFWRSGRDGGISEAFNLGIAAASGDYVAFINSDDWMSPEQAGVGVAALERTGADFVFGNLAMHSADGEVRYIMEGSARYWDNMRFRMPQINHPTVIVRRTAYEKVGPFNPRRRVAMDFDWHLRAELLGVRGSYVPQLLGHMSEGGVCDRQWRAGLWEVREIAIELGQDRLRAHAFYVARAVRAYTRLALHDIVPASCVNALHRMINPRFKPASK